MEFNLAMKKTSQHRQTVKVNVISYSWHTKKVKTLLNQSMLYIWLLYAANKIGTDQSEAFKPTCEVNDIDSIKWVDFGKMHYIVHCPH